MDNAVWQTEIKLLIMQLRKMTSNIILFSGLNRLIEIIIFQKRTSEVRCQCQEMQRV